MNEPDGRRVRPSLESRIATEVTALVAGVPVGTEFTVLPSEEICSSLEYFLPELLSRRYSKWRWESLDGIYVGCARKTGPSAIQLVGICILISDQTMTPFFVELASSPSGESIASFRVCLGEPGRGPLGISGPEWNSHQADELLIGLPTRLDRVDWSYTIASDED